MPTVDVLCLDLGASNGRGIISQFNGKRLSLVELHRFENGPVSIGSHLYWDTFHLYKQMLLCLRAANEISPELRSFGIDGWAQDFGLIDRRGQLLGLPRHYRDPRTDHVAEWAVQRMSIVDLYTQTGKLPSSICTLFQLIAMQQTEQAVLENSHSLLFMPNLLGYFLTGEKNCDITLASASALFSPRAGTWCEEILSAFELPKLLPGISRPGHTIGLLRKDIMKQTGVSAPLISVAQHDTISALLAAQTISPLHTVYISSGTWSVVGTAVPSLLINEEAMKHTFCSEPGYFDNRHFIVKYMTGLWILQECIQELNQLGHSFDYEIIQRAAAISSFNSSIDVENADFASPGHMLNKIVAHCRATNQKEPGDDVEFFICVIQGLARYYTSTTMELQSLTGNVFHEIRILGGGSQNAYLCQQTARLSGIKVVAGPVEASIVGNALTQLISLGEIRGMDEAMEILEHSFLYTEYYP